MRQLRLVSDRRGFKRLPDKNVYTYECENEICDPNVTRTILEVPKEFDNSTKRAEELPYYTAEEDPDSPGRMRAGAAAHQVE